MSLINHLNKIKYNLNKFLISHGNSYTLEDTRLNNKAYLLFLPATLPFIARFMIHSSLTFSQSMILSGSVLTFIGFLLLFFIEEGTIITGVEISNWQWVKKEYDTKKYFGWSFVVIGNLIILSFNLYSLLDP